MSIKSTTTLTRDEAVAQLRSLLKGHPTCEQLGDMLDVFYTFDNFLVSGPETHAPVIPKHCECHIDE